MFKLKTLSLPVGQQDFVSFASRSSPTPVREVYFPFPVQLGKKAMIPDVTFSPFTLKTGDIVFQVRFSISLITGDNHPVEILLPPSQINPQINFDTLQENALLQTQKDGIYAGEIAFGGLKKTGTGYLVAVAYPSLDANTAFQMAVDMNNLFCTDDFADEGENTTDMQVTTSTERTRRLLNILEKKAKAMSISELESELEKMRASYTPQSIAYGKAYIAQLSLGISPEWSLPSLYSYFASVGVEKGYEKRGEPPTEEMNGSIRADAGGAVHAIAKGAHYLGIPLENLEKKYYQLSILKTFAANCTEYSNDAYSLTKEHLVFIERILRNKQELSEDAFLAKMKDIRENGLRDPQLLDELRKVVAFSLPHIRWQTSGVDDLIIAISSSIEKHNIHLRDYYELKATLEKSFLDRKAAFKKELLEANSDEEETPKELLAELEKDHIEVKRYYSILEGWLAHGWWALSVPRYNLGITPCTQERLLELQKLQKSCLIHP